MSVLFIDLEKPEKKRTRKVNQEELVKRKKKEKTRTVSFQPTFLPVEAQITWKFRLGEYSLNKVRLGWNGFGLVWL